MNFKVYLRRTVKSILYIAIIFLLVFIVIYVFSEKKSEVNFMDSMLPEKNRLPLVAFIFIFGLIYPFITFIKKNVYLNKSFEEEQEGILRIFQTSRYELIGKSENKLYFRPTNKVSRVMRMLEDTVELDYSDNPIVLDGMRKEVYRIGKHIEYMSTMQNMEE